MSHDRDASQEIKLTYREDKDEVLAKFKEFWAVPLRNVIDAFLKSGDEAHWQKLFTRLAHLSAEEEIIYDIYIQNLAVKYSEQKEEASSLTDNELILLGDAFQWGSGSVKLSYDDALACFVEAKDKTPFASFKIGQLHRHRKDNKKDFELAKYYLEEAKSKGCASASVALGDLYMDGHGVSVDKARDARALGEYLSALKADISPAYAALGKFTREVTNNLDESVKYFNQAAALGCPASLFTVGQQYHIGKKSPGSSIVEKDFDRAYAYYENASEKGMFPAYIELARLCMDESYGARFHTASRSLRKYLGSIDEESPRGYELLNRSKEAMRAFAQSQLIVLAVDCQYLRNDKFSSAGDEGFTVFDLCATYNSGDASCLPVLFSAPNFSYSLRDAVVIPLMFCVKEIVKQRLKAFVNSWVDTHPELIAMLICAEKKPEAVIKSLTHWLGDKMLLVLDTGQLRSKLGEERFAAIRESVVNRSTGILSDTYAALFTTSRSAERKEGKSRDEKREVKPGPRQ